MTALPAPLLSALSAAADRADAAADWPAQSWRLLIGAGVLAWSIPPEYGGAGKSAVELLTGYELLAGACLSTAFILSQREAAVRRLVASPNSALAARVLPALARGEQFATVGLPQLTTSRQHQQPTLRVTRDAGGFHLDGLTPWVTGADHADLIVIGATLPDDRQVLLALSPKQTGVTIDPPMDLMALAGSRTCQVRCDHVTVPAEALVAGPAEKILVGKPGGVGGLETSCLALGLAGAAIDFTGQEAANRPDLVPIAERFQRVRTRTRSRLHTLAVEPPTQEAMIAIRVDCTRLALQATQVALTVAKGSGFVRPHPAQRWARQALFFLVWSCPRPAAEGVIGHLLPEAAE